MTRITAIAVWVAACGPRSLPPGSPDQPLRDAVLLLCDAPSRAREDPDFRPDLEDDLIAKHLADGLGHPRVVAAAEAWKTDGIDVAELDRLIAQSKLTRCALRDVVK